MPPMFGPVTSQSRESSDEPAIVGDETGAACAQRVLDHRVAAALDVETGMLLRSAGRHQPPSAARSASAAATSSRASASAVAAIASARASAASVSCLEMRGLGGERMGAGLADPQRLLVQIGRVEADDAGQGLAVGEARIRRHQPVGVARRHLDMDSRAHCCAGSSASRCRSRLAVARLQRRDRAPPLAAGGAQGVERGVIALGDIAALRRVERRRGHERAASKIDERAMADQRRQQVGEQSRRIASMRSSRSCSRRASSSPSRSWPRSRGPPRPAASRPSARPMSGEARSCLPEPVSRRPASSANKRDQIEPRLDRRRGQQGRAEIGGEQARAGAGDGAVDRGEQAAGRVPPTAETVSSRLSRVAASIII